MEYKGFIYAPTPKTAWDNLSMQEKSEMMKVAVKNGLTDLKTIKEKYNEFAEGGNLPENNLSETNQFREGGYVPSRAIRQRIANWEGAAMDRDTIDPLSGKVAKKNRSFEEVATGFVNAIPKDIRGQVLGNQELADNLYSYAYNVGPGKFKERVVPALRRYYQGNGSVSEVTDSMWASGDKKLRGLRRRRTEERSGVSRALQGDNAASPVSYISQTDNNGFVPFQPMLPEVFEAPHPVVPYSIADTPKESKEVAVSPYDIKVLEGQRRRDNLQHFMNVLNMVYGDNAEDGSSFFLPLGALGYNNTFEDGGKIHIKPKNRGKFTALKERTGHSATWFKEHGTPAQKKMAVFALNSRHWKHGLGGNLFDDGGNKDNIFRYTNNNGDVRYVYQDNPDAEEVPVRPLNTIFPDPAQWTFTDDAGKFYTPRRTTPTNIAELNPDNRTGFERALDNYIGEAFNTVPKGYHTLPAIGAAAFGLANPAIGEAALTSGFGAHGLSKWMKGEVNGPLDAAMTALEITPLGQLARPALSTLTPIIENEGFALTNPITGNINWVGRGIGSHIDVSPTTDGWLGVDYINSTRSGVGRKLYDAAIKEAHKRGLNGVKSGVSLASAPKTYNIWNHYPNRTLLSTTGFHGNGNMINGEFTTKVNTPEELIEATTQGIDAAVIGKAPVYGLTTPSNNVPFLSFSRTPRAPQITAENNAYRAVYPNIRYDIPNSDIIIESSTSVNPNIPFNEAWLAASKGRHQMSNLVGSEDYAGRIRQAYQDNGIPINQADFEILQAKQGIEDSNLKVVPNLKNTNGEVINGQYDPNTGQILVSQDRENILDVVESSGHEHAHASEVEKLLELLKEKWKHIKPRKEAFTRSDGSIDTEWKDYISKIVEMRAPAMSVWSEMKELGFNKVGDYLHHLKRFGLEDKQWEALVSRYGLTNAKYMVETVFGLSPFVINGISNEKEDNTTM